MTLEIEFRSGGIYQYFDIPESVYMDLMGVVWKGSYFRDHIKNSYRYRPVQ